MKKDTTFTLQSAEIKQIMDAFFANTAPLFCCRPSCARDALSEQILNFVLDVFDAKCYEEICRQIADATNAMQHLADGQLLHLKDLAIPGDLVCFFDMKASCLQQPSLPKTMALDVGMLQATVRQAGMTGHAWAIRTGACLNWFENDPWCARENALRMWKLLAFSGDLFAMRALEYGLRAQGDPKQAAMWKDVHRFCETANNQFLTILPASLTAATSKEAAELAQLIISIRNRLYTDNGRLPLSMLQYAAESRDTLQQKTRTLCAEHDKFLLKLVQEQKSDSRQFGF